MNNVLTEDFEKIIEYVPNSGVFKSTRWLVTGATGMTGSYLLSFLSWINETVLDGSIKITAIHRSPLEKKAYNVVHLQDKDYIEFRKIDLGKDFTLRPDDEFEYVFHAASNAAPRSYFKQPINTINANVNAARVILEHLRKRDCLKAFVYLGSGEIYGSPDLENVPTPEDYIGITDHLSPRSCYVQSKKFAETVCWNYFNTYGTPVNLLRPVHMYGPGFSRNDSRVWADFINRAIVGGSIEILGDGTPRRGFCYLADALVQIILVIQKGVPGEPYNIGNENHVSIKDLADVVAECVPGIINVNVRDNLPEYLKGSPNVSCPSIQKVAALGGLLKTPLKQGVKRTVKWAMQNEEF